MRNWRKERLSESNKTFSEIALFLAGKMMSPIMRRCTQQVGCALLNCVGSGFWEYRYNTVIQVPPNRRKAYRWAAILGKKAQAQV